MINFIGFYIYNIYVENMKFQRSLSFDDDCLFIVDIMEDII